MGLRGKLALALVPLVLAPVIAAAWVALAATRHVIEGHAEQAMRQALASVERTIADLADTADASLAFLADAPEVVALAEAVQSGRNDLDAERSAAHRLFDRLRAAFPEHVDLWLADASGVVVIESSATSVRDGAARGAMDDGWGNPGALAIWDNAQRPRVAYQVDFATGLLRAYRTVNLHRSGAVHADKPAGMLSVSLSMVRALARSTSFERFDGDIFIVSADGDVLHLYGTGVLTDAQPSALLEQTRGIDSENDAGFRDWFGQRSLVSSRTLPLGQRLVVVQSRSAFWLDQRTVQTLVLTLFGAMLLVAGMLVALRSLVLAPLAGLQRAISPVGLGDTLSGLKVRRGDEFGMLLDYLKRMKGRLDWCDRRIEQLSFYDQLTGLPNRYRVRDTLAQRMPEVAAHQQPIVLFLIDLDNFKQINDALGHAVGDRMLVIIADRVYAMLQALHSSEDASLARFGGDELLVTVYGLTDEAAAERLAARMLSTVAEPLEVPEGRYTITASIGIARCPADARTPDGLVRCANLATYAAKCRGRNLYRRFTDDLTARSSERLRVEHRLRHAISAGRLQVHYQPIVAIDSGDLVACEALLRWRDDDLGQVSPARFIPIAEESGLIPELGRWVLFSVIQQIAAWRVRELSPPPIAVNISAAHLQRESLAGPISDLLARFELDSDAIHIEITESVLMDLSQSSSGHVNELSELGLSIHIDDFGTGYSSLSYLRRFDIHCIKIDRSFVANLCVSDEDHALVTAIIAMAKALDLKVIAEGIEDTEQLAALRALGCDFGQGYLFARPMDAGAMTRTLSEPSKADAIKPFAPFLAAANSDRT
jgi:diguanylate cyclase (GGDEF)-like protein